MVLEKIVDFFKMDVKATRFNWYRDSKDWKPYHHDAAAFNPDKGIIQAKNATIFKIIFNSRGTELSP